VIAGERTVNCGIGFVDQHSGTHTNTIKSMWRHVKAFLSLYNKKGHYIYHLAHYMFAVRCRAEKVDQFTKFFTSSPQSTGEYVIKLS
jgi:hypothetical protein